MAKESNHNDLLLDATINYPSPVTQFLQLSQESAHGSSITDSDSVASWTESEQGSFTDQFNNVASAKRSTRSFNSPSKIDKDSPELRAVHNVSEQYRRKYLKSCFDNLQREVVTEANPKASHLLILTSALDVVQQVKDKHGQLKRDHERLLEEQRSLDQRLEEVIRDLHIADPGFDVDQVLAQLDCGNGPESTLIGGVDRPDLFQLEETVLAFHSRGKRPLADVIDHNELENIRERKYSKAPQGGRKTTKRNKKQGLDVEDKADLASSIKSSEDGSLSSHVSSMPVIKRRTFLPLRLIEEPDDGSTEPEVPLLSVVNHQKYIPPPPRKKDILTGAERRRLALEKGLPAHLALGIPTLSGGNYWSQSTVSFPMLLRTHRAPFWNKRVEMTADLPKKPTATGESGGAVVRHGLPRGRPVSGRNSSARDRHLH